MTSCASLHAVETYLQILVLDSLVEPITIYQILVLDFLVVGSSAMTCARRSLADKGLSQ